MKSDRLAPRLGLTLAVLLVVTVITAVRTTHATADDTKPITSPASEPRAKNGKKLLTAFDLMKVVNIGAPRIAPDGTRVAYTASETKTEKDKEWKTVTQIWVTPISGAGLGAGPGAGPGAGASARQYTRGEKSASAPEWSPDGKLLAFLSDREKEGERQVWMMA